MLGLRGFVFPAANAPHVRIADLRRLQWRWLMWTWQRPLGGLQLFFWGSANFTH